MKPLLRLTIKGHVPSKKNSKRKVWRNSKLHGRRGYLIPSEAHEIWHNDAFQKINEAKVQPVPSATGGKLTFYALDMKPNDLTNKAESVMDLLVNTKIIKDDNWFVIANLQLSFGGLDRENPRVEIELY